MTVTTQHYPTLVPSIPHEYRRVRDGDVVRIGAREWEIVAGFGYSPEHSALYCANDRLLISGDMVLPRISTNVSVFALEPEGNPLKLYLDSLGRYEPMPEDMLALLSHGKPFRGVQTRIAQLREHHRARLAEVRDACAQKPCSAADIVPIMFRCKLDIHQMTFALGEALAHLNLLWPEGALARRTGEDGVIRFSPA